MTVSAGIALIAACVLAQGFFAGSATALVSADRESLRDRADHGHRGAGVALALLADEERLVGTCLVGAHLALVGAATVAVHLLLSAGQPLLAVAALVPATYLLGDALPRVLYRHQATRLAPMLAWPLQGVQRLLAPALWGVTAWSRLLRPTVRRADIVALLETETGSLPAEERRLIRGVFAMSELTAESCMTPLVDVKAVPETATVGEAIEVLVGCGRSRLPVYRERVDNIVGHLDQRDLLYGRADHEEVGPLARPVQFVPESKRVHALLQQMRAEDQPMAIVVDEYGGSLGLVTVEDMLAEVLGDIGDERSPGPPGLRRLGEREWRVQARTEIEELEEAIALSVPHGDYETVGGLILAATGRIPAPGEVVTVGPLVFHVEAASERAIHTVRVQLPR